jgi:hypothetical protein
MSTSLCIPREKAEMQSDAYMAKAIMASEVSVMSLTS